jgi:hypothetical protein
MHVVVRLVVEHVEQQRQLAFVLPSSRGATHHHRVRDVHSSCSTAGRHTREAGTGIASAPFRFLLSYLSFLFLSYNQ